MQHAVVKSLNSFLDSRRKEAPFENRCKLRYPTSVFLGTFAWSPKLPNPVYIHENPVARM